MFFHIVFEYYKGRRRILQFKVIFFPFSSLLLMLGTKTLCCKEDMAKLRPAKFFLRPLKLLVIGKFMLKLPKIVSRSIKNDQKKEKMVRENFLLRWNFTLRTSVVFFSNIPLRKIMLTPVSVTKKTWLKLKKIVLVLTANRLVEIFWLVFPF